MMIRLHHPGLVLPPPGDPGAPAHPVDSVVRMIVVGGMPGWQIALIAIAASLVAAAAAVLAYRAWTIRVRLRTVRP